jgi:hypothetical protein
VRGLQERREPFLIWYLSNKLILCGEPIFSPASLRGRVIFGKGNDMEDVIKKLLESNENLLRINSELVEVNKGWQELATEMLHMWAEERAKQKGADNGRTD